MNRKLTQFEYFQKRYTRFDRFAQYFWIAPVTFIFAMITRAYWSASLDDPYQALFMGCFLLTFFTFILLRVILSRHEKQYLVDYYHYLSE